MSGISRRERGWLTLFVLVPLLGTAPTPLLAEEEATKTLVQRLDVYLESCAAFGWSGAALVAKDGKVLLRKGYGFADRNARRANDPNTLFEIASVTKVFTACAVLKLAELGTLGIDDPIAQHLPGVPKDKHDITVRHLLAHTSGMSRRVGGGGSDVRAAVASYLGKAHTRKAGEAVEYWNGGFALLAALIEQVSGAPYPAFCAKPISVNSGAITRSVSLCMTSRAD